MEQNDQQRRTRGLFWLALIALTGYLVFILAPVITPFAIATLIAYITDPLVDRIERWHIRSWVFGRTLAVVIVFFLLTALLVVSVLIVVPLLVRQFRELVEYVPALVDWLAHTAVPWVAAKLGLGDLDFDASMITELAKDYWRELSSAAIDLAGTLGRGGAAVVTLATNLVLIPVVAFYLMRDWDKLLEGVRNLMPRKVVGPVSDIATEINEVLGAFLRGQLLVMLALGVMYSAGLALLGLNMAFLIGMGAGLLSIVPYLGLAIGIIVAIAVAIFQFGDILHVVLVCVVFGVSQSIESMYLTPKLVGDRIGLHPVAVIFAILAGGQLFGFLGILLALPVSAALNVVMRHAQEIYRASYLYRN